MVPTFAVGVVTASVPVVVIVFFGVEVATFVALFSFAEVVVVVVSADETVVVVAPDPPAVVVVVLGVAAVAVVSSRGDAALPLVVLPAEG